MKMLPFRDRRRQSGYSLAEIMIVVGIVGVLSLIAVPSFMNYARQSKVRSATREINSVLRAVRSRAITQSTPMAFSFAAGAAPATLRRGQYAIYSGVLDSSGAVTWTQVGETHFLDRAVYFLPSDFAPAAAVDDQMNDVVFLPNGTIANIPTDPGKRPNVEIRSEYHIPNNHVTDVFAAPGFFKTTLSSD